MYSNHDGLLSDCVFHASVHIADIQHVKKIEAQTNKNKAMHRQYRQWKKAKGQHQNHDAFAKYRWYAISNCMRGIKLTLDGIAGAPGWVLSHDTLHSSAVHQQKLVPLCPCSRYVLGIQQATRHHLKTQPQCCSQTLSCSMSQPAPTQVGHDTQSTTLQGLMSPRSAETSPLTDSGGC